MLISRYQGRELFGQYTLVVTWALLFQTLANFGTTECLAREIGREPEHGSRYFGHGLILATAFAVTGMVLMGVAVWAMQYSAAITMAILLVGGTLVPAAIISACRGVLLATRRIEYMMAVGVTETAIVLPLNAYWIVTGAGLLPIVATLVAAKTIASGLAFALVHWRVTPARTALERRTFQQLWRVSMPFGVAAQLPALRFDVFLLSKLSSFEMLGLYAAASKIAELLLMFPMAFYLTMLPRVAGDLAERPTPRTDRFTEALTWYYALVIPLGIGGIGLAEPIIRFLYGTAFVVATPVLRIQLTAFLLTTVDAMLMMICRATGFQRTDLKLVLVTALLNLAFNSLLIPYGAAVGAALSGTLSILIGLILRWRVVTRSIVRLKWGGVVGAPLAASLALLPVALPLAARAPWPLIAVGYVAGYGVIGVLFFPFMRNAVLATLRQGQLSAE